MDRQLDMRELPEPGRYAQFWYGRLNRISAIGKLEQKLDEIPRLKQYEYGGIKEYDETDPDPALVLVVCRTRMISPSLYLYRAGKQFLYLFKHDPAVCITISRDKEGNATYEGLSLSTPGNRDAFEDIADRIKWNGREATEGFCGEERKISNSLFDYYDANASEKARGIGLSRTQYLESKLYHDFLMRGENSIEQAAWRIARKMGIPIRAARKFFPDFLFKK